MYDSGRAEGDDIVVVRWVSMCVYVVVLEWRERGLEVVSVCWRHTTRSDGTWVCFSRTSDGNVRTLGGARESAPAPWEGDFCNLYDTHECRSIGRSTRNV